MNVEHRTSNTELQSEDAREEHMRNLYACLCLQRDEQAAIASLEDYALRDLLGWLALLNVTSGIPGIIYGHCLVEAAHRFQQK